MPFRAQRTAHNSPRRPVPIHRGPQAVSHPASGSQPIHHAPNAALLIDFDNVTMGIRSDLQTELKNLLASDIIKGKVSVQRAYADWRRYPQYIVPLAESSIDMIMAPAYGSAKKNATDIRLAIDALELVFVRPEIGTFILLSGDSDFSSLVIKLKEYGKYVIGVGIRESSSDLLVMNCDEYYSYNSLAGLVKSGDEEVVKHDPWELVTEAIQKMKRNGDVMRADRLKQVMQQMDPTFDEKNVGKSKFSLFVTEAAKKGLVALTKLENGQFEVDLPKEGTEVAPAEPEAAAPKPPEAEDGRRPRRESRGRGRGRGDRTPRTERPAAGAPAAPVAVPVTTEIPPETAPREAASGEIGSTGLRLTRAEAFDLVKRATASLASGDSAVAASLVRSTARALLGRDSESLSERNFTRILQDAHDADMIDLRRRGSDYEVAVAAGAPTVSAQLAAAQPAPTASAKPAAPAPRGMAARGGRGPMGRPGAPPPHILSVGVVGTKKPAPQPEQEIPVPAIDSPSPSALAEEKDAAKSRKGRKRGGAGRKTSARKKTTASETPAAAPAAEAPKAPARKRAARGGGRKNAKPSAAAAVRSGGAGSEPE
ncbi:MAG TPA: NYN domain-containing protein [Gemmatimonadaceae bacterium]|nr:NYN domain-containing protein [Gemmatimonadaceae bacterium]